MPAHPSEETSGADRLRARFEGEQSPTIGLEEEVMLLDPETLDLAPVAPAAIERLAGDPRFKLELPSAQLEIVTPPCGSLPEAARALGDARTDLVRALDGLARVAGAGAHPFAPGRGVLNRGDRYEAIEREFGEVARRQLVFGLHVHVRVSGAERALAVYNALRGHLPELAALAANAPYYEGADTGLASVRPKLAGLLPRQGVPPPVATWEELAAAFAWGAGGSFREPRQWWWEARLHPQHGTVEVRVPDTQITLADTAAVGAVVHALVQRLADAHDAGELPAAAESWKIDENRWSACRHGVSGAMADLTDGRLEPTRERLARLLDEIGPVARSLGCEAELGDAARLLRAAGAERQRAVAADGGPRALAGWLADAYVPACRLPPETRRVRALP